MTILPVIIGLNHIQMESPGDAKRLRAWLAEAGVAITDDEPLPGWQRFYITDPWGNRMELLERDE